MRVTSARIRSTIGSRPQGSRAALDPGCRVSLWIGQFDVDTTHGNLPKLGASLAWSPQVVTGVAYVRTTSGNLGTNLLSVRIDTYSTSLNWLAGAAFGTASPAVLNLETGVVQPGKRLNEGFVGFSTPLSSGKLTLVADYLDLAGIRRATLTVSYILDLGAGGRPR